MEDIRNSIADVLETVTPENSPRVYEAIQSELGYKNVEDQIINLMIDQTMTASACIPHVEEML